MGWDDYPKLSGNGFKILEHYTQSAHLFGFLSALEIFCNHLQIGGAITSKNLLHFPPKRACKKHADNTCGWGHKSQSYERPEIRRQRNEAVTREYFRNLYGDDPVEMGFEVPDWKWDW